MKKLIGSLVTGAILFLSATVNAEGNRHTFKGATLGMSIDEFRALAFPDVGKKLHYAKSVPRIFRVQCAADSDLLTQCWFEAWSEENAPVCTKNAKYIEEYIEYMNRSGHRKEPFTMSDIQKTCFRRIDVGYAGRSPKYDSEITYSFYGSRLMEIDIRVRPLYVDDLYPKLVIAYGPPTMKSRPAENNRLGARFQNFVAEWRSDEEVIILRRYDGRTDIGQFTFIHRPTVAQHQAGTARATRDAAKDF